MSSNVKVSVIMPVYNGEKYLTETLQAILNQTYRDMEIICVDDGSTDNTPVILQEMSKTDSRIRIVTQTNRGPGAARNRGFSESKGKYILFFDSDDIPSPNLVEKALAKLEETGADIVGCRYIKLFEDGSVSEAMWVGSEVIARQTDIFNYKDFPNSILGMLGVVPWNKMYRADFIRNHDLKFEEIIGPDDITFTAVAMANAEKITFISDVLITWRIFKTGVHAQSEKYRKFIIQAVESSAKQIKALDHYEEIKGALQRFCVDNYIFTLKNSTENFQATGTRDLYNFIHKRFNSDDFTDAERTLYESLRIWFAIIKKHDYDQFYKMYGRKIVVSMTSYPARINGVSKVLETIYAQTRKPDKIVLWLASAQFPNYEEDLPEDLKRLISEQKLSVYFCDDLKAHKKYFYAFEKFKEDLIITIDDDIFYPPDTIESLFLSYLEFPEAVSALRVHLMLFDDNKEFLPYRKWMFETNICLRKPCMQLFATGCSGILYAPELFDKTFLDEKAIKSLCPHNDDLWLKAMEVVSGVPVVLAREHRPLQYLPGTQEGGLYHINVIENKNDEQWKATINYVNQNYENDIIKRRIFEDQNNFCNISGMLKILQYQKDTFLTEIKVLQDQLKKSKQETGRINNRLQQAFKEKDKYKADYIQVNNELQQTKEKCENLERYNQELLDSFAFKIGSLITFIPGTLKRKIKKLISRK